MKTRITLSLTKEQVSDMTKVARKLCLETSTPWTVQETVERCFNIGYTRTMEHYSTKRKAVSKAA
jgi:hypothetical protein